jgi:hypothetical protein
VSAPFWSDDFDMDLLKVLPETHAILGDAAHLVLYTHGHQWEGRLNHPAVWNDPRFESIAFFGSRPEGFIDSGYYTGSHALVECTFLEAVRDAWPHHYALFVDRQYVWSTVGLMATFDALMWHRRGWQELPAASVEGHLAHLRRELREASTRIHRTSARPALSEAGRLGEVRS